MTIIEPNKNRQRVNVLFWGSISLLVVVALWSIAVYNDTVNLSHDLRAGTERERTLQSDNAEMKNKRYTLVDARSLHAAAASYGLVKVTHPEYLELSGAPALANR